MKNQVIDIDEDVIRKVASMYNELYTDFSSKKIKADGYVLSLYGTYVGDISSEEEKCSQLFSDIGKEIINSLNRIGTIDESIAEDFDGEYNFNDVISLLSSIPNGSKMKKADKDFFEQCPNAVIKEYKDESGNKQFKVTCDGYEYDSKSSKLTLPNGKKVTVKYYVPSDCNDVSSLNTFTALSGAGESSVEGYPDIKNAASNSIVIIPSKPHGQEDSSFYSIKDEVVGTTVFANKIAGQKKECQNIIAGCSAGGCSSLKIAADSKDTYDTVVCINNAALVGGVNANKGTKEQFDGLDSLRKLDGKNIYFISTKSDPNLDHCATSGSGWAECNNVSKSYLYTGVELVVENCPNSQVYLITNSDYKGFNNIKNTNGNYHYSSNYWNSLFGKRNYASHAEYKNVIYDLINNGFVDYNRYSSI